MLVAGETMSSESRSNFDSTIKAFPNSDFPHDRESLRKLSISASKAWHENDICDDTRAICIKMEELSLSETLKLLSEFMDIDPIHGACLIGALRRYITLHYPDESESRTDSRLLRHFEQSIITLHDSFHRKDREKHEQKVAYEVLIYERVMVEKRRKFNTEALKWIGELREVINGHDEHGSIIRDGFPHQLFTFPNFPLAYVDLQTGLLRSRLDLRPHITLGDGVGDGDVSIDMTKSIGQASEYALKWEGTDFGTSSKVRYFVFMNLLVRRDRFHDQRSKPHEKKPWKSIEKIANQIAESSATNRGLIRLLAPVLKGEPSGSGDIRKLYLDRLCEIKEKISYNDIDNIHTLLRRTVGDISLNNPLKTADNNPSNLSMFREKTSTVIGSPEYIERIHFAMESMSNGVQKIINTNNALSDAVFANSLRWEKISKPSPRKASTGKNIERWLAKSTGHLVKIDTALGSEFSENTQSEFFVDVNARRDVVGVLNQYMSGFQPLPFLAEERHKSRRRPKRSMKISKTTKMNRISTISTCIKEILSGLVTEGHLLEKDILYPDSDRYNLLILPQKFKDSWTLETLHYTLLFNSLHINRLVTHWHVGRTMVLMTTLPGVYKTKMNSILDKIGILIGMELLHALTVLRIIKEVGKKTEVNVKDWLMALGAEIKDAGGIKGKPNNETPTWKHPSYERMFRDVQEVLIQRSTSVEGLSADLENGLFLVVKSLGKDVIQGVPSKVSDLNSTELIHILETLRSQHIDNLTNKDHNFSPQKILATRLVSARLVQDFLDSFSTVRPEATSIPR